MSEQEYLELLEEAREQVSRDFRQGRVDGPSYLWGWCSHDMEGFLKYWVRHHKLMFELEREYRD